MTLSTIILLILLGLILIFLEVLVIPGTTFVGIIGIVVLIAGVVSCFTSYGVFYGSIILGGIIFVIVSFIIYSIRSKKWENFILKDIVNSDRDMSYNKLKEGDKGVTISRLNPIGKAIINDEIFEVTSIDGFIDQETEIFIHKLVDNKIIVKQLKN